MDRTAALKSLVSGAIGLFVFSLTAAAQGMPATASAATLLQQAINAHGARWTAGQVSDWTAQGKLTYYNAKGPVASFDVTLTRKGAAQVQRSVKQAVEVRTGSDGVRAWDSLAGLFAVKAQGPPLQFIESQTVRSIPALLNYPSSGLALTDRGQSNNNRVIDAVDPHGRTTTFYIDSATYLVTRLEFVTGQGRDAFSGRTINTTDAYVFSDYRPVQGLLTPFKVERFLNGIKTEETQFTSVQYNTQVKDDVFKP